VSDRHGGYIDGLDPVEQHPLFAGAAGAIAGTIATAQALQTMAAVGTALRRLLARLISLQPMLPAIRGTAALAQEPQRVSCQGTVRVTRELRINVPGERVRVYRLDAPTLGAVDRVMERLIAEAVDRAEAMEAADLVVLLDAIDRQDRRERAQAAYEKVLACR